MAPVSSLRRRTAATVVVLGHFILSPGFPADIRSSKQIDLLPLENGTSFPGTPISADFDCWILLRGALSKKSRKKVSLCQATRLVRSIQGSGKKSCFNFTPSRISYIKSQSECKEFLDDVPRSEADLLGISFQQLLQHPQPVRQHTTRRLRALTDWLSLDGVFSCRFPFDDQPCRSGPHSPLLSFTLPLL